MDNTWNRWREIFWIRDTPGWAIKYPTGPVHFDIKCNCGTEHVDLTPQQIPENKEMFLKYFPCFPGCCDFCINKNGDIELNK